MWSTDEFIDAALQLGADTIVAVHLTGGEIEHQVAVDGLGRLCDQAREHGLRVALEFMPFSGIRDVNAGWHVIRDVNAENCGMVVDICHVVRSGSDLSAVAAIPADRIYSVQLGDGPTTNPMKGSHDADALREEAMYHRQLPGEGEFDTHGFLSALARQGVRTRVGPELYQRVWSERPAAVVAADLIAATREVLGA